MPTIYVFSKNKKIIIFLYKKFHFTAVKNGCILHGHVFVMKSRLGKTERAGYFTFGYMYLFENTFWFMFGGVL